MNGQIKEDVICSICNIYGRDKKHILYFSWKLKRKKQIWIPKSPVISSCEHGIELSGSINVWMNVIWMLIFCFRTKSTWIPFQSRLLFWEESTTYFRYVYNCAQNSQRINMSVGNFSNLSASPCYMHCTLPFY